ncbi:hypothetical protein HMSSN139_27370 [Paenibacillus sp. HMSSN-139]|nr:hypothetical protein HMSSN139_27370 [Paenibacillus sp. HMSSN-139]
MLFTLPFYRKYLSDEPIRAVRIDWLGGGALGITVTLLLLGVTYGRWELYLGSLIGFLLFLWRIRLAPQPFVDPRLFRNRSYSLGLLLAVLVMGIGYALPFLTPQLLADVNRLPAGWIGFAMVPGAVASAILGRKGGKLADAKGNSFVIYVASLLLISCFALISVASGAAAGLDCGDLDPGQCGPNVHATGVVQHDLPHAAQRADRGRHGAAIHAGLFVRRGFDQPLRQCRRSRFGFALESVESI